MSFFNHIVQEKYLPNHEKLTLFKKCS